MSQFATLEVVITTLQDAYGKWIKAYLKRHEVLVLLMCFVSFVLGLPHVMQVSGGCAGRAVTPPRGGTCSGEVDRLEFT